MISFPFFAIFVCLCVKMGGGKRPSAEHGKIADEAKDCRSYIAHLMLMPYQPLPPPSSQRTFRHYHHRLPIRIVAESSIRQSALKHTE